MQYKLETNEAIAIMVNLLCNKFFVLAPLYMKYAAGNAIFIMMVISFIIAFVIWQIYISSLDKNTDLLDLVNNNFVKTFVGGIIIITITIVTTLTLRQYGEGIKVMTLKKTPVFFIIGIFAVAMLIGASCGLRSIGKTSSFFIPIIYILAISLVIATIKPSDLYNFFPVMGKGFIYIAGKSIMMLSMLFEILLLFFMPPLLRNPNDFKRLGKHTFFWTFIGFCIIGGIYGISSLGSNTQSYEPFFRMIKQINLGNFLQRCDSIFLILYCISAFLYLSTMLFFITHIASKSFKINDRKALVTPIGLIITTAASVNIIEQYMYEIVGKANYFLWIAAFILPATILFFYKLRSKA